jgi:hypothetical protein
MNLFDPPSIPPPFCQKRKKINPLLKAAVIARMILIAPYTLLDIALTRKDVSNPFHLKQKEVSDICPLLAFARLHVARFFFRQRLLAYVMSCTIRTLSRFPRSLYAKQHSG